MVATRRTILRMCLALCAAMLTGCGPQKVTPEARATLEAGVLVYEMHEPEMAVAELDHFISDYRRTERVGEAYYYRGMAHRELGHDDQARSDLLEVLDRARNPDRRATAFLVLGDLAAESGDHDEAKTRYRQAIDGYDRASSARPPVLLKLADLLQRQGEFADADLYFNQLTGTFPDTPEGRAAAERVHCRYWTVRLGTFSTRNDAALATQVVGSEAITRPDRDAGRLVFHVQIGAMATYLEGQQLLTTHAEQFPAATLIVSR